MKNDFKRVVLIIIIILIWSPQLKTIYHKRKIKKNLKIIESRSRLFSALKSPGTCESLRTLTLSIYSWGRKSCKKL